MITIRIAGYFTNDGYSVLPGTLTLCVAEQGGIASASVEERCAPGQTAQGRPPGGIVEFCPTDSRVFLWGKSLVSTHRADAENPEGLPDLLTPGQVQYVIGKVQEAARRFDSPGSDRLPQDAWAASLVLESKKFR